MARTLNKLFVEELKNIFDAETQMARALVKLSRAALSPELRKALRAHIKETKTQLTRLKTVFTRLKLRQMKKRCLAVRALLKECDGVLKHYPKSAFRDAAIIAKLQRVKHYEMSAYGTLCAFAKELDLIKQIPALLHKTFDQEMKLDRTLTKLAKGNLYRPGINRVANEWAGHHRQVSGW
jgi:ferritin-like metal-binding protein YciE